jgi:hypothetical protein
MSTLLVFALFKSTHGDDGKGTRNGAHDARLVGTWRDFSNLTDKKFLEDGRGVVYDFRDIQKRPLSNFVWHTDGNLVYSRYISALKPNPEWGPEQGEQFMLFVNGIMRFSGDLGDYPLSKVAP